MRFFIIFSILVCLAFPVFSQNVSQQRFNALSDSMGTTISRSTETLADYDANITDNGNIRTYTSYKKRYEYYVQALRESEGRMELLFRTNDRTSRQLEERDTYENLLQELQAIKSDYDNFVRTVR